MKFEQIRKNLIGDLEKYVAKRTSFLGTIGRNSALTHERLLKARTFLEKLSDLSDPINDLKFLQKRGGMIDQLEAAIKLDSDFRKDSTSELRSIILRAYSALGGKVEPVATNIHGVS